MLPVNAREAKADTGEVDYLQAFTAIGIVAIRQGACVAGKIITP